MKNNKSKTKKPIIKHIILPIFFYLIHFAYSFAFVFLIDKRALGLEKIDSFALKFVALTVIVGFALYLIMTITMLIHELGHLVFGKISGYSFGSIRVFSFLLSNKDGKLKLSRFNIPGTGGQCLMVPPVNVGENYNFPFFLYNLGGSLANFIVALVMGLLLLVFPNNFYIIFFALFNIITGFFNIVPAKLGGMLNDGYNILLLKKSAESRQALWATLNTYYLLLNGKGLNDLPDDWFEFKNQDYEQNHLTHISDQMKFAKAIVSLEFEQAKQLAKTILEKELLALHSNEVLCELLFIEIVTEKNNDEIIKLYTKHLKKHINSMQFSPSKIRLLYAYSLLVDKNKTDAERLLAKFEKLAKIYPYAGEIKDERSLIEYVDSLNK